MIPCIKLTPDQSAELLAQLSANPGCELRLVPLGTPGRFGPVLIEVGEASVLVEEDGAVEEGVAV